MSELFQLGTFAGPASSFVGIVINDEVIDLNLAAERSNADLAVTTVAGLIDDWDRNFDRLLRVAAFVRQETPASFDALPVAKSGPLPPLGRPGKQLYAAANFRDHVTNITKTFTPNIPNAARSKDAPERVEPTAPYMFAKPCELTGAYADIILPFGMQRIDWEAELMVVIGRSGRNVPADRTLDHIAGYMTTNDISCRDRTWRPDRPGIRSDWLGGKSYDSFAPTGPYFTPKAFVRDHADLAIKCWINGVLKQDGNSGDMIFGIEAQIEYASRMMTLRPGDVIATGTPAGTGQERLEFLTVGDVVETEVEHCGRQRNTVVAGPAGYIG